MNIITHYIMNIRFHYIMYIITHYIHEYYKSLYS